MPRPRGGRAACLRSFALPSGRARQRDEGHGARRDDARGDRRRGEADPLPRAARRVPRPRQAALVRRPPGGDPSPGAAAHHGGLRREREDGADADQAPRALRRRALRHAVGVPRRERGVALFLARIRERAAERRLPQLPEAPRVDRGPEGPSGDDAGLSTVLRAPSLFVPLSSSRRSRKPRPGAASRRRSSSRCTRRRASNTTR